MAAVVPVGAGVTGPGIGGAAPDDAPADPAAPGPTATVGAYAPAVAVPGVGVPPAATSRSSRSARSAGRYTEPDAAAVRHIRTLLAAGLPTAVIAQVLLHRVHDEGERVVPSACLGMVDRLRQEQHRTTEEIERLRSSRRAPGTLLAAALERPEGPDRPTGGSIVQVALESDGFGEYSSTPLRGS